MSSGGMVKRYRFNNQTGVVKRRCDYCHQLGNELYHVQFAADGPYYWLHPLNCFRYAQTNYLAKKNQGITPAITPDIATPFDEIMQESIAGEKGIGGDDL